MRSETDCTIVSMSAQNWKSLAHMRGVNHKLWKPNIRSNHVLWSARWVANICGGNFPRCVDWSRQQSKMASSQFGANAVGERRQRRSVNPVGLRGISSPLFRETLIETWGLAWRTRDNSCIVSLFSESRRPSTAVSLQGAWLVSKLELSLLSFAKIHQLWCLFLFFLHQKERLHALSGRN